MNKLQPYHQIQTPLKMPELIKKSVDFHKKVKNSIEFPQPTDGETL